MTTNIIVPGNKIEENFIIAGWPDSAPNRFVPVTYLFLESDKLAVTVSETNQDDIDTKILISFLKYHQIIQGNWEIEDIRDSEDIFSFVSDSFTTLTLKKVH